MDRPLLQSSARIGILNRGEAALRFVRAVREYNACHGTGLEAVAFHTDVEEEAPFAEEAHLAFPLSRFLHGSRLPTNSASSASSTSPAITYLNRDLMLEALKVSSCSGAWAGWGFLSEDALFVGLLEEEGLVFLGPSARSMALLGDKITAKDLAEKSGVPILPWSRDSVQDLEQARVAADSIGYPCIIKAAAAGGARGIRPVKSAEQLPEQFRSALEEARRITGEGRLFIERLVERARHLEVQVLADRRGNVATFGVRTARFNGRTRRLSRRPLLQDCPKSWQLRWRLAPTP